jgi:hypothetical protein
MAQRQVHVVATAQDISSFVDTQRTSLMCFRCGEVGHLRYQCLTYKVRLCWHYSSDRKCPDDTSCSFAHGEEELRTPWKARCVRVVKQGGKLVCIGCNSTEHTFRKCPHHQDLVFL